MNVAVYSDKNFDRQWQKVLSTSSLFDPLIDERTRSIMAQVQKGGDKALIDLTRQFDGASLTRQTLFPLIHELL